MSNEDKCSVSKWQNFKLRIVFFIVLVGFIYLVIMLRPIIDWLFVWMQYLLTIEPPM